MMVFGAHCYVIDNHFDIHFFKEGFVGVSFFFMLSGFIIAYNYQKKFSENKITKRTFWVARIARIYPLHWLTLLIAVALGNYVIASGTIDWCKHFLASLTLTNAYIPKDNYFFSFNSPSWSLCCEQLFYICFPFLIAFTKDYRKLLSTFLICAILSIVGMYFTPMITSSQGSIIEIASIALIFSFYQYAADIPKENRYSCYYWIPIAFILISFSLQKGMVSRLLSNRLLVIGGEISYSFYLIHLFVLLSYAKWQKESDFHIDWYISIPLLFCVIILLSLLSYYYFEKPMNKLVKTLLSKQSMRQPVKHEEKA